MEERNTGCHWVHSKYGQRRDRKERELKFSTRIKQCNKAEQQRIARRPEARHQRPHHDLHELHCPLLAATAIMILTVPDSQTPRWPRDRASKCVGGCRMKERKGKGRHTRPENSNVSYM